VIGYHDVLSLLLLSVRVNETTVIKSGNDRYLPVLTNSAFTKKPNSQTCAVHPTDFITK
jgi:hypothetical protein